MLHRNICQKYRYFEKKISVVLKVLSLGVYLEIVIAIKSVFIVKAVTFLNCVKVKILIRRKLILNNDNTKIKFHDQKKLLFKSKTYVLLQTLIIDISAPNLQNRIPGLWKQVLDAELWTLGAKV